MIGIVTRGCLVDKGCDELALRHESGNMGEEPHHNYIECPYSDTDVRQHSGNFPSMHVCCGDTSGSKQESSTTVQRFFCLQGEKQRKTTPGFITASNTGNPSKHYTVIYVGTLNYYNYVTLGPVPIHTQIKIIIK